MTRKEFELIASVIKSLDSSVQFEVAKAFADRLVLINPRFDRDKFYDACMDSITLALGLGVKLLPPRGSCTRRG